IDTPSAEDLARFDRKRKGKTLSNADWKSPTDPEAKIARMKDGTTHLALKARARGRSRHGRRGRGADPSGRRRRHDDAVSDPRGGRLQSRQGRPAPSQDEPCVLVADKGYHARDPLKALEGGVWKTRIAEPEPAKGYLRWHGDDAARKAVYANRAR